MAPFLAPARMRVERRHDLASIFGELLLGFGRRQMGLTRAIDCPCPVREGRESSNEQVRLKIERSPVELGCTPLARWIQLLSRE